MQESGKGLRADQQIRAEAGLVKWTPSASQEQRYTITQKKFTNKEKKSNLQILANKIDWCEWRRAENKVKTNKNRKKNKNRGKENIRKRKKTKKTQKKQKKEKKIKIRCQDVAGGAGDKKNTDKAGFTSEKWRGDDVRCQ
jgi:hypothetical protein